MCVFYMPWECCEGYNFLSIWVINWIECLQGWMIYWHRTLQEGKKNKEIEKQEWRFKEAQ
jgi:hypothetical protein